MESDGQAPFFASLFSLFPFASVATTTTGNRGGRERGGRSKKGGESFFVTSPSFPKSTHSLKHLLIRAVFSCATVTTKEARENAKRAWLYLVLHIRCELFQNLHHHPVFPPTHTRQREKKEGWMFANYGSSGRWWLSGIFFLPFFHSSGFFFERSFLLWNKLRKTGRFLLWVIVCMLAVLIIVLILFFFRRYYACTVTLKV